MLVPSEKGRATPVVAALRVVRGKGADQEVGYIPATGPVGARATVADNRSKGSVLSLTAPGAHAAPSRSPRRSAAEAVRRSARRTRSR